VHPRAIGEDPVEILQNAGLLALEEARMLENAGFDALILENFGDIPFYLDQVPPETVAALSVISAAVKEAVRIPVGLNVLRNDARSALAIAAVNGLEFIRVNVLSGVAATDQGWAVGGAAALLRERDRLHAGVAIFADVAVKHAINYSARSVGLAVEEVVERAGAGCRDSDRPYHRKRCGPQCAQGGCSGLPERLVPHSMLEVVPLWSPCQNFYRKQPE
jgi:membrane complex biogenesis BtpA family protein